MEAGLESGRLASATVRDVMSPGVVAVSGELTAGACAEAMHHRRTHAVLVVDSASREPIGWVSHRDVLMHVLDDPLLTLASASVSQEPAWIDPAATVEEAVRRMQEEDLTHLLVGEPGTIAEGVISSWDVVGYFAERSERRV
jgi:CBS domain containing-hemolysin-like protein